MHNATLFESISLFVDSLNYYHQRLSSQDHFGINDWNCFADEMKENFAHDGINLRRWLLFFSELLQNEELVSEVGKNHELAELMTQAQRLKNQLEQLAA